jgi:hypothetical protein
VRTAGAAVKVLDDPDLVRKVALRIARSVHPVWNPEIARDSPSRFRPQAIVSSSRPLIY